MDRKLFLTLAFGAASLLSFLIGNFIWLNFKSSSHKSSPRLLRFNENHEFTILQITDLHYGEAEWKDLKNDQIQEKLINYIKPDMVVITGDAVSGYAWNHTENFYHNNWKRFTDAYLNNKVLYAYALGNHDIEADASLDEINRLEKTHPYSLFNGTKEIDPLSLSNYLLHVYSSFENKENNTSALLWIFDSKKKCEETENGNGCINQSQLDWYEKMSQTHLREKGQPIQGMSFFHVPIHEFMNVWNDGLTYGMKDEVVSCPPKNTGVFDSFKKMNNMRVVACGHDHNNNYGGTWQGIDLIFGLKTGYGSYGPSSTERGARVFKLTEILNKDGTTSWDYQTYLIFEDGTKVYPEPPHWQGDRLRQKHCGEEEILPETQTN